MNTQQFLDYLHGHTATRNLAEEIAYALALRGRRDLVPAQVPTRLPAFQPRRLAS